MKTAVELAEEYAALVYLHDVEGVGEDGAQNTAAVLDALKALDARAQAMRRALEGAKGLIDDLAVSPPREPEEYDAYKLICDVLKEVKDEGHGLRAHDEDGHDTPDAEAHRG